MSSLSVPDKTVLFIQKETPQTPIYPEKASSEDKEPAQTPLKVKSVLLLKKSATSVDIHSPFPLTPITIEDLTPQPTQENISYLNFTIPDPMSNQGYLTGAEILDSIDLSSLEWNEIISFVNRQETLGFKKSSITFSKKSSNLPRTLTILKNTDDICEFVVYDLPKKNQVGCDGSSKSIKLKALFAVQDKTKNLWIIKRVVTCNAKNKHRKTLKGSKQKAYENLLNREKFFKEGWILINKSVAEDDEHCTYMQDWKGNSLKEKGKFTPLFFSLKPNQRKNLLINHIAEIKKTRENDGKFQILHDRKWENVLINKSNTRLISIDDIDKGAFTYHSPSLLAASESEYEWELKTSILGYTLMMTQALFPSQIHLINFLPIDKDRKEQQKKSLSSKDPIEFLRTDNVEDKANTPLKLGLASLVEKSVDGKIKNYDELHEYFVNLDDFL